MADIAHKSYPQVARLYADAVREMRDGDIALFRAGWWPRPSSLLIARGTDTLYCHAEMLSQAPWDHKWWMLGTRQFVGGRARHLDKEVRESPGRWDIFRPRQLYDEEKAVNEMARIVDCPYGYWNLFRCALRHTRIISRFLKPLTDDQLNGSAPFCSQAVSRACRAGGRDPRPNHADILTEPGHLADPAFSEYLFTLFWDRLPKETRRCAHF